METSNICERLLSHFRGDNIIKTISLWMCPLCETRTTPCCYQSLKTKSSFQPVSLNEYVLFQHVRPSCRVCLVPFYMSPKPAMLTIMKKGTANKLSFGGMRGRSLLTICLLVLSSGTTSIFVNLKFKSKEVLWNNSHLFKHQDPQRNTCLFPLINKLLGITMFAKIK